MKKTVIVNEELCTKIESLQYEVESRKEIIAQVVSSMIYTNGNLFEQYQEEYRKFYIEFNQAKAEMLRTYGISDDTPWNLDFATRELTYGV